MNDKEIGEIRRHLRRDRSNITAIYGCYVNDNKEVISEFRQSTGIMPENESDKYFALLRRSLSGAIGKNLIDITFKTSQVAGSPEHKMLMDLRETGITGKELEHRLDEVYITANKNTIPDEPLSPFVTSGLRLGTPAVTSRGLVEADMDRIAGFIADAVTDFEGKADAIRAGVDELCSRYPLYE